MKPDPLPPPIPDLGRAMVGSWRLLSREDYDREGRRVIDPILGADPMGFLTFTRTSFAMQLMKRDRDEPAARETPESVPSGAGANNTGAVAGYDAYFGRYSVDAVRGEITVMLEASVVAANVGMELTRDIRAAGDRLWIRLPTTAADGTPITRTLTFERMD
jgi:lipocalin-like protein